MLKKPKLAAKIALVVLLAAQFVGLSFLFPKKLDSANLTNVSDTLSNNRLSFRGQLDGAVPANSGVIILRTTGLSAQFTSSGSASLMGNENVKVGTNAPIAVKTIETASRVSLASGLTTLAADGGPVIATVSAVHTTQFTPVSAIPNGAFRVLIPATSTYGANDGLPDRDGFDMADIDVTGPSDDVTCSGGSGYTFKAEYNTATASAFTISGVAYHSFECRYTGTGGTGTAIIMTIGTSASATRKLINPSPSSTTRYPGEADVYTFRVRHTHGTAYTYSMVDESLGRVGVVEAVRVTAVVSPTLTFQISGRAANSTSCGQATPTDVGTTYNSVPFGTSVSVASFANLAQQLVVSTNAAGGYAVTASQSGLLTAYSLTGTPTIANTLCNSGTCAFNDSSASLWTDTTKKGFGYALENVAGSPVPTNLRYAACGAYCARPFGTTGATIMTTSTPVDSDIAYVCYRIIVSGIQAAGDYENYVIYIATATF